MAEEYISLSEYAKRYKMNKDTVKQMIRRGEVKAIITDAGYYKIKVGGDMVPRKEYDALNEKYISLKTKIELIMNVVGGVKND